MKLRRRQTKRVMPIQASTDKEEVMLSLTSSSSSSSEEEEEEEKVSSFGGSLKGKENKHEVDDVAREQHDLFNLVALPILLVSTAMDWDVLKLEHVGDYFCLNWATTIVYFILDLLWVARIPKCVKSPGVIIKHHLVAMIYLSFPFFWPEYRWVMGACLSVEINTWFMIARRVMYKKDQFPVFVQKIISYLYFFTWIVIRIFVYPYIMYLFIKIWWFQGVIKTGKIFHWPMVAMPVHFCLCVLNLRWSYDLFRPIIMKRLGKQKEEVGVQSGL